MHNLNLLKIYFTNYNGIVNINILQHNNIV